jgi:hypothetical protein
MHLAESFHHVSLSKLSGDEKNIVFEAGDPAEHFYYIAKGQIELWRPKAHSAAASSDSKSTAPEAKVEASAATGTGTVLHAESEMELFAIIGAGHFFGECGPHEYRVTAKISPDSLDTLLLSLTASGGLKEIQNGPYSAAHLHATLSLVRRLRTDRDYLQTYAAAAKNFWPVDASRPADHLRKSLGMPDGFVSGARYLAQHKYPNTKVEGLIQNIKHPWLARYVLSMHICLAWRRMRLTEGINIIDLAH